MPADYNKIARFCDLLSRLVYGKSLIRSQRCLLSLIPAGSSVLVVGGGTGWILEDISKLAQPGISVTYVELSASMIRLAKKRALGNLRVDFDCQPFETYEGKQKFDCLFTAYFLDNFSSVQLPAIFQKLSGLLKEGGIWLYADFVDQKKGGPVWQKLLLKLMYLFFRISCGIEATELADPVPLFASTYLPVFERTDFSGFLRSCGYRKLGNTAPENP